MVKQIFKFFGFKVTLELKWDGVYCPWGIIIILKEFCISTQYSIAGDLSFFFLLLHLLSFTSSLLQIQNTEIKHVINIFPERERTQQDKNSHRFFHSQWPTFLGDGIKSIYSEDTTALCIKAVWVSDSSWDLSYFNEKVLFSWKTVQATCLQL